MRRISNASNASIYCEVVSGELSCNAIYKPIAGERPLWDFESGNLASREVAAYLVDQVLGFGIVPPTVLRDGPFGIGAVQLWIDDAIFKPEEISEISEPLRKIALFDVVINNTDRKIGHLLYRDDHVWGCDHGVTFHEQYKLRTVLWQFSQMELTHDEIERLQYLNSNLPAELDNLISADEITALKLRIDDLLTEKRFPLPPTDWPAVPWPPF
jgi:hypothetical protein